MYFGVEFNLHIFLQDERDGIETTGDHFLYLGYLLNERSPSFALRSTSRPDLQELTLTSLFVKACIRKQCFRDCVSVLWLVQSQVFGAPRVIEYDVRIPLVPHCKVRAFFEDEQRYFGCRKEMSSHRIQYSVIRLLLDPHHIFNVLEAPTTSDANAASDMSLFRPNQQKSSFNDLIHSQLVKLLHVDAILLFFS